MFFDMAARLHDINGCSPQCPSWHCLSSILLLRNRLCLFTRNITLQSTFPRQPVFDALDIAYHHAEVGCTSYHVVQVNSDVSSQPSIPPARPGYASLHGTCDIL